MNKYRKVIKIAIGSTVSILIAYALGLNYAISAGIITLLTLQDTKKETINVTLMRIVAFIIAAIVAFSVFSLFSYHPIAFGLFLLLFVGACFYLKAFDAISMNAVLATHYFLEKSVSIEVIRNETLLLVIGAGVGILLNLFIPSNVKEIIKKQRMIEEDLRTILTNMALQLESEDKSTYGNDNLELLKNHIDIGLKQAYTNMNNTFFQETRYYIEYMEMRKQQSKVLHEMHDKIRSLAIVTPQGIEIADFMLHVSDTLSESQNAKNLLQIENELLSKFKKSGLPISREEFENRAVLYVILMDLLLFLKIKEEFADSLTDDQRKRYWSKHNNQ